MALKAKKGPGMAEFKTSHALIIGINNYGNGIYPLTTPVNDATRLGELLAEEHEYEVHLLVEDVSKARIASYFNEVLPAKIDKDDRLLLYFAGHGVALDGEDGPQGFLVPQDANRADRDTLLSMMDLHAWLDALPCRHMLAILDCCFAGAFRWAAMRDMGMLPELIHQERYDRYLASPAWQVLTSAAYDQRALDVVNGKAVGSRGVRKEDGERHSPFALALYEALQGEGDLVPKDGGDGVITATELYLYLREEVEVEAQAVAGHEQTPGLWQLNKHGRGEYIFLTPGHELNLPPAPDLTEKLNPWRGLKSYDQEHGQLFFGRDEEIKKLAGRVEERPFTVVLGASGTGKSSLVKAGLLPYLEREGSGADGSWTIMSPLRPGARPLLNLSDLFTAELPDYAQQITPANLEQDPPQGMAQLIDSWKKDNPSRKLLLVVDQLEELVTLGDVVDQERFLWLLAEAVERQPDVFRLIITLRTDFEPQFDQDTRLEPIWEDARYVVPPMDQADLRQVIEGPASERVLYFDPPELVDNLITEVIQTPGALPLLSFTLSEMYIHYLNSEREDRALAQADYDALGGVIGSLRNRANAEYEALPDDAYRETMERVMLRMISVEGGELARRRVHEAELVYATEEENERVKLVRKRLVAARLLVSGEEDGEATYEPAHDALVLAWDNLLRWKKEAEGYLPLQRRVAQAATEWYRAQPENRSGFLWDDNPRLPQLEETLWPVDRRQTGMRGRLRWAKQVMAPKTEIPADTKWLNGAEVAFVQASVRARARFWQRLVIVTSIVILALAGLTLFATNQANIASVNEAAAVSAQSTAVVEANLRATEVVSRTLAEEDAIEKANLAAANEAIAVTREAEAITERNIAQSRQLAVRSPTFLDNEYDLALLLGVEARKRANTVDARASQLTALEHNPKISKFLHGHNAGVVSVAFSPNGQYLASGDEDGLIILWDLTQHPPTHQVLKGHNVPVRRLVFDTNGKTLVSAAYPDNNLSVPPPAEISQWDVKNAQFVRELGKSSENEFRKVAISPGGEFLALLNEVDEILIWDVSTDQEISRINPGATELGFAFDAEGKSLVWSGSPFEPQGDIISLGPVQVGVLDLELSLQADVPLASNHANTATTVATDATGQLIASASYDGSINLDNFSSRQQVGRFITTGWSGIIEERGLAFSPDSSILAIGDREGGTLLYDTANGSLIGDALIGHSGDVLSIAFGKTNSILASGGLDGKVVLWDLAATHRLATDVGSIYSSLFSPDGEKLAVLENQEITMLDPLTLKRLSEPFDAVFEDASTIQLSAFFSNGKDLVTNGGGNIITIWDTGQGKLLLPPLIHPTYRLSEIALSPNGQFIASTSARGEGSIFLWDTESLEQFEELEYVDTWFNDVVFSSDSTSLISGTSDGKIMTWDTATWQLSRNYGPVHEGMLLSLAISPDDQLLASAGTDRKVRLWRTDNGRPYGSPLSGHSTSIWELSFSSDGKLLASVSDDHNLIVWDVQTGQQLGLLQGKGTTLDFSMARNSYLLANGGLIWNLDPSLWSDSACKIANRNLTRAEWDLFLGAGIPYELTCPHLPPHPSIIEYGRELARAGEVEEAILLFEHLISLYPKLAMKGAEEEVNRITDVARAKLYIEEGNRVALTGAIDDAVIKYQEALSLDNELSIEPHQEAVRIANLITDGQKLASEGRIMEAISAYKEAQLTAPDLPISAKAWNHLCWYGSLWGHSWQVVNASDACELAVDLAEIDERPIYQDSRAVAYLLSNWDRQVSIADLKDFVVWSKDNGSYQQYGSKRDEWLQALEVGRDPFTVDVLEELKCEGLKYSSLQDIEECEDG